MTNVSQKEIAPLSGQPEMRRFVVRVLIVPTNLEMSLGAEMRWESRVIYGYTLKDAKRRAGLQ